tara:strand:- start:40 stop:585 length:546 start_codon:yes stop_codon:yes gene_type:complete
MNKFGGWAIQESCYNLIKEILPEGKTILELGSGYGTDALSKHYNMISIENQPEWVGVYNSHYIQVPIRSYEINTVGLLSEVEQYTAPDLPGENSPLQKGWYDYKILSEKLEGLEYDLILVDGPNGVIGRGGFLKHIDIFNTKVPLIFDDINREAEMKMMKEISKLLNKPYTKLDSKTGYIL